MKVLSLSKKVYHLLNQTNITMCELKVYRHGFELMARGIKQIIDNPLQNCEHAEYVEDGRYFKVIDDNKMDEVLTKINSGNYAYQN